MSGSLLSKNTSAGYEVGIEPRLPVGVGGRPVRSGIARSPKAHQRSVEQYGGGFFRFVGVSGVTSLNKHGSGCTDMGPISLGRSTMHPRHATGYQP